MAGYGRQLAMFSVHHNINASSVNSGQDAERPLNHTHVSVHLPAIIITDLDSREHELTFPQTGNDVSCVFVGHFSQV